MPVTFTTKAYADITMFGDVAIAMLKLEHGGTVPGAIRAEDFPAALSRLSAAIDAKNPLRRLPIRTWMSHAFNKFTGRRSKGKLGRNVEMNRHNFSKMGLS
jgi:hypothetical protein